MSQCGKNPILRRYLPRLGNHWLDKALSDENKALNDETQEYAEQERLRRNCWVTAATSADSRRASRKRFSDRSKIPNITDVFRQKQKNTRLSMDVTAFGEQPMDPWGSVSQKRPLKFSVILQDAVLPKIQDRLPLLAVGPQTVKVTISHPPRKHHQKRQPNIHDVWDFIQVEEIKKEIKKTTVVIWKEIQFEGESSYEPREVYTLQNVKVEDFQLDLECCNCEEDKLHIWIACDGIRGNKWPA